MSKVFEALQKLERELGRLPQGVLPEAQQVFQNGSASPEAALTVEEMPVPVLGEARKPENNAQLASVQAEPVFRLDSVPAEIVEICPETRLVYFTEPNSPGADRFRLLRMRLWPLWEAGKLKTLLVTSAQAKDGKSTVVMNLATALAEQGQRNVLVVEGDLYHPTLSERLAIPKRAGLAECLESAKNPLSLLQRLDPVGWYLLPAGRAQGNPTELLQSPILGSIFETLRSHFDWIIIDTPPVVPLTDTLSLRQYADAGLLVVRADRTPGDAVEAAIGRVGAKNLLGIVLNRSNELDGLYSDYRKCYSPRHSDPSNADHDQ